MAKLVNINSGDKESPKGPKTFKGNFDYEYTIDPETREFIIKNLNNLIPSDNPDLFLFMISVTRFALMKKISFLEGRPIKLPGTEQEINELAFAITKLENESIDIMNALLNPQPEKKDKS